MLCVAQCYDSVFVMSWESNRVETKLREKVPHVVFFFFLHCHSQILHLVLTDCLKNISELSEFFSMLKRLKYLCNAAALEMNY